MKSFLDKTAEYIIDAFRQEIDRVCIVLPNRRAGLFLKRSLARQAKKTIWSPQIYSLEDFIISLSGFKVIDPVYLQFELYKVHREIEGVNAQSFEDFIRWGRVLLNDFNEVDKYLVDPDELFGYLSDEKALSLWNPENNSLTDFQVNYLRFYQSLNSYYHQLRAWLNQKNEVYQGMAYRKVAMNIENLQIEFPWNKIIFAGFNALTHSENRIFLTLKNSGKAEILWDADKYYMENEMQEAGKFIRSIYHHSDKTQFKWLEDNFGETKREITLFGVPQNVGQVKITGQLLSELAVLENELDQTAVVLNDESMVEPLLNSVPIEVGKFNLTMGLPLKSTPLFRLIDSIFELQTNILKLDKSQGQHPKIYYKDLLRVLEHPYIYEVLADNNVSAIVSGIKKSNKIFLDYRELLDLIPTNESNVNYIISSIIIPWKDRPTLAMKCLLDFLYEIKIYTSANTEQSGNKDQYDLKLEYLFHFNKVFIKLDRLLKEYTFVENLHVLRSLFLQMAEVTLPFYGEPLRGLQIMGMLESQTLDFKNIIMLGVNEDFIPAGKSSNSFIPYDIRRKFLLPTYHDRNAVYAYHFYRSIQRAEKISIIYNTEPGDLGGGDKSRFIAQMQYELPKFNPEIKINERILSVPTLTDKKDDGIVIAKTNDIIKKLSDHAVYGFSASAFNTFRNCPLQFYFKYVAGIDEAEEPEETIEANTLGSVIHDVLAKLYNPLKTRNVTSEDFQDMKSKIEFFIIEAFRTHFSGGDVDYGKNLLVVKVAIQYIQNFLKSESADFKKIIADGGYLKVLTIEEPYSTTILTRVKDNNFEVKLTGRFDRVDELSGDTRIIDYKTGRVDPNELKLRSWDELTFDGKLDKVFQLLLYTYIFNKAENKNLQSIIPGIISFRSLSSGLLTITLPENETLGHESIVKFELVLKSILTNIFDPEIPFSQTDQIDNCKFCSFTSICNRD